MSSSTHSVGERLSYDGALCTVRYVGEVEGANGSWLGVEWDDPSRGKHDGQHKGVRYFHCKTRSLTAASFVRPTRPVEQPLDFLAALQEKYASEVTRSRDPVASGKKIIISGKVAEEVGFDKIRRKLAQLNELKIVILDGMRVASAYAPAPSPSGEQGDGHRRIKEVCPKVIDLDLSRNLFTRFGPVVEICSELVELRSLRINGNRFITIPDDDFQGAGMAFKGVKELSVEETLLGWDNICRIASKFSTIHVLLAGSNQLSSLSPIPPSFGLTSTLTSVNLEFNDFTFLSDVEDLTAITSLRNLHLKGNNISTVMNPSRPDTQPPVFTTNLQYLDLSYNRVSTWSFIDTLPTSFPGLTSLRFAHNPIYDNPELDTPSPTDAAAYPASQPGTAAAPSTDESYMLTVARLPGLRALNFSAVAPADRTNAEMFYLSRIARQLSSAPPADEPAVLARHRRWADLCAAHGEPAVARRTELDPNLLEARLVSVAFRLGSGGEEEEEEGEKERFAGIPKSFDVYAVKGIAGRLFGLSPLRLRLVWETGEWDPVAGFDEEAGDSSDEEELEAEREKREEGETRAEAGAETEAESVRKAGRWVKREVELKDGPRQFGYCVDGLEAKIRVEVR